MYVNGLDKAGSTPVARGLVAEEERQALYDVYEARLGADSAELDDEDPVTVFDARGGFLWTMLTVGSVPTAYFRQPFFAVKPKWTLVPETDVPDDIRGRFFT